jgi:hypothetical protein
MPYLGNKGTLIITDDLETKQPKLASIRRNRKRALSRWFKKCTQIWICPICNHEQHENLNWCGKNLTCQNCHTTNYYKDWTTK